MNFKNAIWTWGHFRKTICNIILEKMPQKHMECFRLLFWPSCMNWASVFEWHKGFKVGRESVRDGKRCGRSKEVNTPELIGQKVRFRVLRKFRKRFRQKKPALLKSGHWHFHQDNAPVHNSILVTDYSTKMGIKTVDHPLFPKPRDREGSHYMYSLYTFGVILSAILIVIS